MDDKCMVKLSLYRNIFETKFNLAFGFPKQNYEFAFNAQKLDRTKPTIDKKICYITMDVQQTMPLPKLSTSKAFYLRQIWLYNFGIHSITYSGHKSFFFTWTEDTANRGSNEIAKLHLYKKLNNTLSEKVNLRDTVKWIRVNHFGFYCYKATLDPFTPFLQVDLHKKGTKDISSEEVSLRKLPKCGGLTVEKTNNLREQLKYIEKDYIIWFYEELLNENIVNPKKKRKTY
nr:unnamed protein product [Callosobruchus chinensis]